MSKQAINLIGISGKIGSGKDTVANMIHYCNLLKMDADPEGFDNSRDYSSVVSEWETKRFADKLKDMVCLLIGCSREQLEDREFKEKPLGEEWDKYILHPAKEYFAEISKQGKMSSVICKTREQAEELKKIYGLKYTHPGKYEEGTIEEVIMTPRLLMQLIGTECGREILHPNIWVNALFADYKKEHFRIVKDENGIPVDQQTTYPKWIIPDTRFPNEAQAIRDRGGILIRVERDNWRRFGVKRGETRILSDKELHPSETSLDDYKNWDFILDNNGSIKDLLVKVKEIHKNIT